MYNLNKRKKIKLACYWPMHEVKEEILKCNIKGRINITNRTIEPNKKEKLKRKMRN